MSELKRLKKLSDCELFLLNSAIDGYEKSRDLSLSALRSSEYEIIHKEYLEICHDTDNIVVRNEALKRLIFLHWYYVLEPVHLTGIFSLDEYVMRKAYEILDKALAQNWLDEELIWMLSHYSAWDYIISQFSKIGMPALTNFVKNVNPAFKWPLRSELEVTMNNRGQMGYYWKSINDSL